MYGNYLGLNSHKRGAPGSSAPGGSKYGRGPPASASTRCQKCGQLGHWTSDCKNPREYHVRPTRTQVLKNPKLRTPLTESVMARTEEMPREGIAAAILAANEAKRAAKAAKAKLLEDASSASRGRSRRRSESERLSLEEQVEEQEQEQEQEQVPLPLSFAKEAPRPLRLALALSVPLPFPLCLAVEVALSLAKAHDNDPQAELLPLRLPLEVAVAVEERLPQPQQE
ncbi:hypothetical protein JCM6882_000594 [Rhodosporidiobolus microsporus]